MKAILVGKGGGWRLAPMTDYTWGLNDLVAMRDLALVFYIHTRDCPPRSTAIVPSMVDAANAKKINVIGREKPIGLRDDLFRYYPEKSIVQAFGADIFASTFDYMMAYAIFMNAEEIELHGFTMSRQKEHNHQLQSGNFWIGLAMGRGIPVHIMGKSHLMITHNGMLYGANIQQNDSLRK